MEPAGTASAPVPMASGDTIDFTVKVLTAGVEIKAVQLSMTFDTRFLEVVDAVPSPFVPGVQIQPHPETPFPAGVAGFFTLDNEADNATGIIRYTVGGTTAAAADFDLAIITFRAKDELTLAGIPTKVVFVVQDGKDTAVSKSGALLHKAMEDFTGAFISIQGS